MLRDIPIGVQQRVRDLLSGTGDVELVNFSFASGGCINPGGKLITSRGAYFLKWNHSEKFKGMFEAERKGLQLLHRASAVRIPIVHGDGEDPDHAFILMEWIHSAPHNKAYWINLGRTLAALHKSRSPSFGLDHNNYMGSLPQYNQENDSWSKFFVEQRLEVQVAYAADRGHLDQSLIKQFEKLYKQINSLLPLQEPSLLHGDLWSGNVISDEQGNPCLIDPAVYYGHREVDLAMTRLFGGFDPSFYDAYKEVFPTLPGDLHRSDLYNLYPLLVHLNLFGPSYLSSIRSILKTFI